MPVCSPLRVAFAPSLAVNRLTEGMLDKLTMQSIFDLQAGSVRYPTLHDQSGKYRLACPVLLHSGGLSMVCRGHGGAVFEGSLRMIELKFR